MKAINFLFVGLAAIEVSAPGQMPKPGYWDKGCPEKPLFTGVVTVSGRDFIEVHQLPSYGNGPVYTVRIYGDGGLVWRGEAKVQFIGEASGSVEAVQAKALIAHARQLGFGGLCNEYVMRALDGPRSVTRLSIGGEIKEVTNTGPSNAPSWLYRLADETAVLEPVQKLIGTK